MTNEELIKGLEKVERNINQIKGQYEDTKRWRSVYKIQQELEFFHITITENHELDIYYCSNSISGMHIISKINEQIIVYPLMILYASVLYRVRNAKKHCKKRMYSKLLKEKEYLGNIVREVCTQAFEESNCIITKGYLNVMRKFLNSAVPQLNHYAGEIGEVSTKVVPSEADKLNKIRSIYKSFKVGTKYVYFYDEILDKETKIPIDSTDTAYAIMIFFSEAYTESIMWLKEYDPLGQWCLLVPWKLIQELRYIIERRFFSNER